MRNVERAPRFERAQSAARAHVARGRGNLQRAMDEITKVNWGRLAQCVDDRVTEFTDRKKPNDSFTGRLYRSRYQPQRRLESSRCPSSYQRAPECR